MEKNLDEAVKWLRKAAELGHKDAMVKLGELLSGTEEPFTKLLEKSYMEGYADGKNGKANKYLKEADIKSTMDRAAFVNVKVGDIITFGNYWQGKDESDGKQPVEWQVLDVKDGKALVISKYGLINHEYNEKWTGATWETCTLRKWLNDTFIKDIFSAEEMKAVTLSDVSADKNPRYNTNQGNDTKDKLFLLSIKEVEQYFVSNEKRLCKPTKYAVYNGADKDSCGHGWWWLRSAGDDSRNAAFVDLGGSVCCNGNIVFSFISSVRPAFWLNL
ncbi:DUF6273 domain-containing protein [Phascolarctobacterium succinatutens]|uniref:DUF6273 domain-containing protein n=1 Tax=Phascolarctobacterium succinatutens TaxID=626940 RepID=UPI00307966E6